MDVLAGVQGRTAVLEVESDGRRHRDGIDLRLREHLFDAGERPGDAVTRRRRFRPLEDGIAQRPDPDAVLDVVLGQMGQDAAQRHRTDADHADPQRLVH